MLSLLVFLLFCAGGALAYPSGAGSGACSNLLPDHGYLPQTGSSPYQVIAPDQYSPGSSIQVTLKGDRDFKGFLLVATTSLNGSIGELVGSFVTNSNSQALCSKGITHTNNQAKNNLVIQWDAPATAAGSINFYATFVQKTDTYWVKQQSQIVWDGVGDRPTAPATTTSAATSSTTLSSQPQVEKISTEGCGKTKTCWQKCTDAQTCDYLVSWKKNGDKYDFEVFAANVDGYAALGIAPTSSMTDVSVIACTPNGVQLYYAKDKAGVTPVSSGPVDTASATSSLTDKMMSCRFTYDNSVAKQKTTEWKDLSSPHNLLLARGNYFSNKIQKHPSLPEASASVDFNTVSSGVGAAAPNALIKAHGALMILAWVLCASIGIIMARYFKPMWTTKKACGQKIWFQVHRALMLCAMFITIIAFILILVYHNGMFVTNEKLPYKAHPILGLIAIICSLLNPLIAAFRCHPGTKNRPIFNWVHWFFGTVAHVFAVVAIFLGMLFEAAHVPWWLTYVMMAYCLVHVITEFALEIHNCCMYDKNRDRQEQFELMKRNDSETKEPEFAGRGFRCVCFTIYVILVVILALVMLFVVAFWRNDSVASK